MERRTALVVIGSAAAVPGQQPQQKKQQHEHGAPPAASAAKPYTFRFFTPAQAKLVDTLAEIIIPTDDQSPGAREARVVEFIDWMVSHGSPDVQAEWTAGLALVDGEARKLHGRDFTACSAGQQDGIVAAMARNEASPATPMERFFRLLKLRTVDGYYTSSIAIHKDLRYQGNRPKPVFIGCTHSNH